MKAGHLSREHGVGWRWGTSDWAIRSVSLWGQGKVMKSGGEPSSSLKHKFSKRLHGLLGRWAPSFLVRESENSVCVWSAEDASVGFGWSPVTKVNIWAKSLLESDLVYGRDRNTVCVCTQKRACLLPLASLPLLQMIKHCLLPVLNPSSCWNRTLSDGANHSKFTLRLARAKHTGNDSVFIYTATTLNNPRITMFLLL